MQFSEGFAIVNPVNLSILLAALAVAWAAPRRAGLYLCAESLAASSNMSSTARSMRWA